MNQLTQKTDQDRADWEGMGQTAFTLEPRVTQPKKLMRRLRARADAWSERFRAWMRHRRAA